MRLLRVAAAVSKGSGRRPTQVDESTVEANWAAIFANKGKPPEPEQTEKEQDDGE
jgi:hypothetical protein